ncbi:MAG: HU family DNA-binding protein [SAR324 cluster bacterium]|nr:HU family DNA-binding protein [SAR324 cluster bacterium]MCZ6533821.1 HU family DNA-binding protein [SAR324 cluster bacterium]MCZ6728803.1 HU family DNA-binding protein [SAR324 cluster bacterium]MCZ6842855.1 HU family DNA-binding protein [SAR324 cluster bacterium]
MTKADLIDKVANDANVSKSEAGRVLNCMIDSMTNALASGDTVTLVGFGTFSVTHRAARRGRNPQTGAEIQIAASKSPRFKAGKALKDKVR